MTDPLCLLLLTSDANRYLTLSMHGLQQALHSPSASAAAYPQYFYESAAYPLGLYQALMRSTLCIISRNGLHQLLLHIAAARQHDIFYFTRLIILLRNEWP